jgi:TIR domain-containing protein/uncharacterized protein DUF4062
MPFTHDIFISYGHIDDQDPFGQAKGWVDLLHERLLRLVGQALGEEPKIWRDAHDLQGNDELGGALSEGVMQSRLLLPVITPRYLQSDWCQREIEAFQASEAPAGGVAPNFRTRIFKVVKTPLPKHLKDREPVFIRNLIGYQFYAQDEESGRLTEFTPDPSDKPYYRMLTRLVADITKTLIELKYPPKVEPTDPSPREVTESDTNAPIILDTESGSSSPPDKQPVRVVTSPPAKWVYVAETTTDLADERQIVLDELRQRGYGVLPEEKLPSEAVKKTENAVRADLARCVLSIHLVGMKYGSTPEDDPRPVVRIQEQLAAEHAAVNPEFQRLLWMPQELMTPAMEISDERQKSFISELQSRLTASAELLQTSIEDLKTRIVEKLSPPAKPIDNGGPEDKLKQVYLICENRDQGLVEPIADYLFNQNLEVITWLDEAGTETLMEYHRKNLKECDAALVYFGTGDEPWVRKNLDDLKKAYGYGRESDWLANAVYVGLPVSAQKKLFRTHKAKVIRPKSLESLEIEGTVKVTPLFDPEDLRDFLSAINTSGGVLQ